jgi:prevent-host-death family protein
MKKMDATRARQQFAHAINQVAYGRHRIVVSRRGKDLAAIVPMNDLELLEKSEESEGGRGRTRKRRGKARASTRAA